MIINHNLNAINAHKRKICMIHSVQKMIIRKNIKISKRENFYL